MKFLHVPVGRNYWAGIFLIVGTISLVASLAFFIFNMLFSAFGLMQFTGGIIQWNYSNPYLPAFVIVSGGKVGLIMGILGGLLASIAEGRLWIVPNRGQKAAKSIVEKKTIFILFSLIFVFYDVLSSYYFLSDGIFFNSSQGLLNGFGEFIVLMGATILFFSIGPEMFMVWSFETMAANWDEGIVSVSRGIAILVSAGKGIITALSGIFQSETDDEEEDTNIISPITNSNGSKRGRGRPSNIELQEERASREF